MTRIIWIGLMVACGAIILPLAWRTEAAAPVDIATPVNERSTPDFTLRFAGPKRCTAGASAGHICAQSSECPGSICAVTTAAPTQVVVQIDAYTVAPTVNLLAPLTLAGASVVTFTPAGDVHRIVQSKCVGGTNAKAICIVTADCPGGTCNATVASEKHMLTIWWTDTCIGGANSGAPCTADGDCPGSACRVGNDAQTFEVINTKFVQP